MTYEIIKKRNKTYLNIAKFLTVVMCSLFLYYARVSGLLLLGYLFTVSYMYKKESEKKKSKIQLQNTDILFFRKISIMKCLTEGIYYNYVFGVYCFLLVISLDDVPKEHFWMVLISIFTIALMIHLALIYRFKYTFVAFEESFLNKGEIYNYRDIIKVQMIKTKSNEFIIEMATKDQFLTTKLDLEQSNQLNLLIEKFKQDCN